MFDLHRPPHYYGNWNELEKLLIQLAKRHGSKYDYAWHGDSWVNLMGPEATKQICDCFICHVEIVNCDISTSKVLIGKQIRDHGMMHLKERGLLPFL